MKSIQSALLATSLLGITSAHAEPTGLLYGKLTGDTAFDRAWSAATLHKDDDNQILQEFSLQGRLHLQSIFGEDGGNSFNTSDYKDAGNDETVWGNDIEARRARFGFKSKWFQTWKFDGLINVDVDNMDNRRDSTLYKDIYDLHLTYAPSDALNVGIGKTKVKFTREQEISSNNIVTLERSLLSNTLFPGELTGIWASGKGIADHWLYEVGFYGNDRQREFSDLDGGTIFLAKVGYDYAEHVGYETAVASIHYMHNTHPGFKPSNTNEYTTGTSPAFKHSIALTNEMSQGRFGFSSDVVFGDGEKAQSQVMGVTLIPTYFIADGLQLVGRLQVATAEDPDDLRVSARYERLPITNPGAIARQSGNTYTSLYAGLNYYIYGQKLKLMNGIEYSKMGGGDYEGYTLMSGLRFSF